ncbi:MAG TPA: PAS domain-containing protein, partial [Herpetosiphonaceae bacterium]
MNHDLAAAVAASATALADELAAALAALEGTAYAAMDADARQQAAAQMVGALLDDLRGERPIEEYTLGLAHARAATPNYRIEDFRHAHLSFQAVAYRFVDQQYPADTLEHARAAGVVTATLMRGMYGFYETYARERERALLESEQEFRALFAAMNDIVILFDQDGRYLKVAPTNPALLYRPPAELVGKTVFDVLPREVAELNLAAIRQALLLQRPAPIEYQLAVPEGARRFAGSASPVNAESVVLVVRDVTEQKELEEDRRRAQVQEEILRAQEAVLAELSTPLIPITDEVVIMPLIGAVDSRRAQQVIEALLHGVASTRARTAILDITGVPIVDTQ